MFQLYGYVKYLAMAKFGGTALPVVEEGLSDGASSDQVPGHGAWSDGTKKPGKFPGLGGSAVRAPQWGGSSSSTKGGGPAPAVPP